jgi:hypothetical protein
MGIVRIRESSSALLSSARSLPDPMPVAGLLITPPIVQIGFGAIPISRSSSTTGRAVNPFSASSSAAHLAGVSAVTMTTGLLMMCCARMSPLLGIS